MKKMMLIFSAITLSILLFSCSKEDSIDSNISQKEILLEPLPPGTYYESNAVNRWLTDGCRGKSGGTCIIIVKALQKPIEFDKEYVQVSDEFKNKYINEKLSEVVLNLEKVELKTFKDRLEFNKRNQLVSFDMDLLRKGAPKTLKSILSEISVTLGGDTDNIYIVDNEEEIKL